jgi:hypothetical protein
MIKDAIAMDVLGNAQTIPKGVDIVFTQNNNGYVQKMGDSSEFLCGHIDCSRSTGTTRSTLPALESDAVVKKI